MFVYKGIERKNGAEQSAGERDREARRAKPFDQESAAAACTPRGVIFTEHRLRCGSKNRYLTDFAPGSAATAKSTAVTPSLNGTQFQLKISEAKRGLEEPSK